MPQDLVTQSGQAAIEVAKTYARQSLAEATRQTYAADWNDFSAWCRREGFSDLPAAPRGIAAYLASLATTHAPSTIKRRLVAIGQAHRLSGHDWLVPGVVRQTLKGMMRRHGVPPRQAVAICTDEIRRPVGACDDGLTGTQGRGRGSATIKPEPARKRPTCCDA